MAFDPIDFYRQASAWYEDKADDAEPRMRSIVSRAYYSAFLVAREQAKIKNSSEGTHKLTAEYYKTNAGSSRIGNRLDDLRLRRNSADYDLRDTCGRRKAGEALAYAKKILNDLNAPA